MSSQRGRREAERLLQYFERLMPEPVATNNVAEEVVLATGWVEADRLFDFIETALRPVWRRLQLNYMGGDMTRTVSGSAFLPRLFIQVGSTRRFEFCVFIFGPMPDVVSWGWIDLNEHRRQDLTDSRWYRVNHWKIGVVAETETDYSWRYIPKEYQALEPDAESPLRAVMQYHKTLAVPELPPLEESMYPFLEYIVQACLEEEHAWRAHHQRIQRRMKGAG
jgi:hypothetical protein